MESLNKAREKINSKNIGYANASFKSTNKRLGFE
jgi:hypothetical protein